MALDEPKGWIALVIGLLVTALGLIPLLATWNVIGFNLPEFMLNIIPSIAVWLIAGLAIYLFIDAIMEDATMKVISIIAALIFLAIGVIQILFQFGVIGFSIPFLGPLAYYIIFTLEGIFIFIAAFAMDF